MKRLEDRWLEILEEIMTERGMLTESENDIAMREIYREPAEWMVNLVKNEAYNFYSYKFPPEPTDMDQTTYRCIMSMFDWRYGCGAYQKNNLNLWKSAENFQRTVDRIDTDS